MFRVLLLVSFLFLSACASSTLLRDKDYRVSETAAHAGDFRQAYDEFPSRKESGGFVTSVEKAWLLYWQKDTPLEKLEEANATLQKQILTFEERKFLSLSRESMVFFFQESEDGYVPAEHEAVVLHLLSAQLFIRMKMPDKAEVEVRRATFLLQGMFNETQPHFDDPALRLWLASLWMSIGNWEHAQVDLRKAGLLSDNKKLIALADANKAPKNWTLTFYGITPILNWSKNEWHPEFDQISRSWPESDYIYQTLPWYQRHHERNTAVRESLLKSNYMAQFLGTKTNSAVKYGATGVATAAIKTTGIILGGVLIGAGLYAIANAGPGSGEAIGYLFAAGVGVGSALWKEGDQIYSSMSRSIEDDETRALEDMRTYRFVRFLPQFIALDLSPSPDPDKTRCTTVGSSEICLRRAD